MTNQIASTHKLHSTKSTIGFQEAWRMAERGGICVIESSDKTRIQHAAPPARKSSQGICAGKGRVCEPSNWQREVTLLLLFFSTSCTGASGRVSSWWLVLSRALLHICLLELCSLFLWLSVAAHPTKHIPRILRWHENLSRVPQTYFSSPFPRPLLIRACVHAEKLRLARETKHHAAC